jgi:hypothetical protein
VVNGALRVLVTTGNVVNINKERRINGALLEGKTTGAWSVEHRPIVGGGQRLLAIDRGA